VTNVNTGVQTERIYATTYSSTADWTPTFTLPPIFRNQFNLSPSVSFSNVDGSPFWIRNERTGGEWVHQAKRPLFSLSASPTLFGLYGGFGPFTRLRHAISPTLSYSFAPAMGLSDEFLAATGRTKVGANGGRGYFGGLRQNSVTLGLSTNVEAKTRSLNDSNPEAGDKLKLLSVNFDALSYDFELAKETHSAIRGLTTSAFGYTVRSDLLPGFDLGVRYSLFQGSTLSDTAKFSPFREGITASFQFSNTANPFAVFQRLFGKAVPPAAPGSERLDQPDDERYARQIASQPVAGRSSRNAAFLPTVTKGWQVSLQFTSQRQRPISGNNVLDYDPTILCQQFNTPALRLAFEQCVAQARTNPSTAVPVTSGLPGSPIYRVPNTTTLGGQMNFNITEHWAASWQTQYDFENRDFATQIVSLQRDLHDWRAIFAFTQSPNGSFAFNFLISLKAEPDLKFDYHKATYRNEGF
jgi:lipopolysaccharide transport LptD-like protein